MYVHIFLNSFVEEAMLDMGATHNFISDKVVNNYKVELKNCKFKIEHVKI